jgi:uncharacterized integral membrane protein
MRIVTWTVRIIAFLVLAALAAKNSDPVTIHLYFDRALQAPLAVVLFCAFALGVLLGLLALLGALLRQRREIASLRKQDNPATPPAAPPV